MKYKVGIGRIRDESVADNYDLVARTFPGCKCRQRGSVGTFQMVVQRGITFNYLQGFYSAGLIGLKFYFADRRVIENTAFICSVFRNAPD